MTIITTTASLESFCKRAASEPFVTVDTEFVRETTYWSQLCLIQVGLKDEAVAIDPLVPELNLQPFFDLLQNSKVTKVFHSGRQDIEIFFHTTGKIPAPIFDTQIAGMVCGFGESVAYDVLVQRYTKVRIDKSSRYTHWARRPLTDRQLSYALGDVTHLRVVYENLKKRILEEDRLHWLEDEINILINPGTYSLDPYAAWERIKVRSPQSRMLAILRELAAWRELTAQERNIPKGRVLKDEQLVEISASCPQTQKELGRMRGLQPSFINSKDANIVLDLVKKAQSLPLEDCPQPKRRETASAGGAALVEMLRLLLKIKSEKYRVAQKLIATTSDLEEIARSPDPLVPALEGWRKEIFGNAALDLKSGKVAIGLKNNKITLIPV